MQRKEERRELFRVVFKETVWGTMTLIGEGGVTVKILDISSQGALVETDFDISSKSKVFLDFKINSNPFSVPGSVIRKVVYPDYFQYGILFSEDKQQFQKLFRELNTYKIRKAKPYLLED